MHTYGYDYNENYIHLAEPELFFRVYKKVEGFLCGLSFLLIVIPTRCFCTAYPGLWILHKAKQPRNFEYSSWKREKLQFYFIFFTLVAFLPQFFSFLQCLKLTTTTTTKKDSGLLSFSLFVFCTHFYIFILNLLPSFLYLFSSLSFSLSFPISRLIFLWLLVYTCSDF